MERRERKDEKRESEREERRRDEKEEREGEQRRTLCGLLSPYVLRLYRPYALNKTQPDLCSLLSADDIHHITGFISDFITLGVTPALNKKLLGLQEKVAAVRRGFRNQVKLLFKGRETKTKAVGVNGAKSQLLYDLTSGLLVFVVGHICVSSMLLHLYVLSIQIIKDICR